MNARARVITISTRTAAGTWQDTSGPVIVDALAALDIETDGPVVIPDGDEVEHELRRAVTEGLDLVITTGGTGHTPSDRTPEATRAVIDRESPGLAEAIRAYGVAHGVPTSILSRGVAGISERTLIINLPGSRGGASDGMVVLAPVLPHAIDQLRGGDHSV